MTSIIEKRRCLHKNLAEQKQHNKKLKMQLGQLQALANIGTSTSMIAHEINNLLTPLSNYAALALNNPDDKALTEKVLTKTLKNSERACDVMQSILALVSGEAQEQKEIRLIDLIRENFNALCRDFTKDGINVKIEVPEDVTILAVVVDIQQVLMNLILNAREAMLDNGGTLTITAEEGVDCVKIKVADTGCGIEQGNLDRIFDPFFTTKKGESSSSKACGSGLGLAFCKKVIDACEGSITVESEPAKGSDFTITLPKSRNISGKL